MQIETHFSSIERVVYTFDEADIQRALMAMAKIPEYIPGKRIVFEMAEDGDEYNYKSTATITIVYEKAQEGGQDDGE